MWAAISSIAVKFGMTGETLRKWVRQAEIDGGRRARVPQLFGDSRGSIGRDPSVCEVSRFAGPPRRDLGLGTRFLPLGSKRSA